SSVSLNLGSNLKVNPKHEFEVPVKATNEMQVGSLGLKIKFPTEYVSFEGIKSSRENLIVNAQDNTITVAWLDLTGGNQPMNLKANDVIFTIKFKPTEQFKKGMSFNLELENVSEIANPKAEIIQGASITIPTVEGYVPEVFALRQNYPNPFNPSTQIEFDLPDDAQITLSIYNLLGEKVADVIQGEYIAGTYKVQWLAKDVASGMYIYRIYAKSMNREYTATKRMMLLK
ncbi:MAG: T9SS type A sorting domain-containing protein, partial [Ignavibacteria bacterium]|nr:T9SS type A sorting domain-containing protein [Ignavibacteria bacterium]